MHPSVITRTKNGVQVQMDISEYLFVHAQRLENTEMLRPVNQLKYKRKSRSGVGETNKLSRMKQLREKDGCDEDDALGRRKLYQRGLGLFNKLVVNEHGVTCSCENFRRFGMCEDSELLGFVCLGERGQPTQETAIDFNRCKEGFPTLSSRLQKKLLDLVDAGNVSVQAPPQDPSKVRQDPQCNE